MRWGWTICFTLYPSAICLFINKRGFANYCGISTANKLRICYIIIALLACSRITWITWLEGGNKLARDCIEFEWDLNPNVSVAQSFFGSYVRTDMESFFTFWVIWVVYDRKTQGFNNLPPVLTACFLRDILILSSSWFFVVAIGYYPEPGLSAYSLTNIRSSFLLVYHLLFGL